MTFFVKGGIIVSGQYECDNAGLVMLHRRVTWWKPSMIVPQFKVRLHTLDQP